METVRRELRPWLVNRVIEAAERVDAPPGPKYACLERAAGQRVLDVRRRGKFLIAPLDAGDELIIHLGMTGVIRATPPEKHLRVRLLLSPGKDPALYFQDTRRFGRFLLVPAGDYQTLPTLRAMGPDPLEDSFTAAQFYAALQRSKSAIKPYLLSQKPVSGVGNIYADEALWRSRVHPLTPANLVSKGKAAALREALRQVMAASIEAQGTTLNDYRTVNGEVGAYLNELDAYGHAGEPCRRCGKPLQRIVIGGRSSFFCSSCQRQRHP